MAKSAQARAATRRLSRSLIEERLQAAARRLLRNQPNLFKFTKATKQSEWNIGGHYAKEVARLFPGYDMDADVIKPGFARQRPDIIIHQRDVHRRNLLVVEVKRHLRDVEGEIAKIRGNWFRHPLRYRYGAVVVINDSEPPYVKVIHNEAHGSTRRRVTAGAARRVPLGNT